MSDVLLVTIISELVTLVGVIITCVFTNNKTLYRIEQLEKKQEKYNNVIQRTFVCEKDIELIKREIQLFHPD